MSMTDPKELERRLMLDTYSIFGCDDGEPTFRYSLLDGVKDGFLINPTVVDVETGLSADIMSKEGLTFKGVDKEGKDVDEQNSLKKILKENLNQMKQTYLFVMHLFKMH